MDKKQERVLAHKMSRVVNREILEQVAGGASDNGSIPTLKGNHTFKITGAMSADFEFDS